MENGLIILTGDLSGYLMPDLISYPIPLTDIGYYLTMAGPGRRIIAGDGLHFIMAAGISITIMAGSGYLGMNGVLHGYHGEELKVIMAGLQWNPG